MNSKPASFAAALAAVLSMLLSCGCMSVKKATDFKNVKIDEGRTPVAVVEIENSVWLLFNFLPIASGDPDAPGRNSCRFFTNTVTLQNNVKALHAELRENGTHEVANLTSRYADEKYLFFLLARRACHTSAVLAKPIEIKSITVKGK